MFRELTRAAAPLALLLANVAAAWGADEISHACAAVDDPATRLACYDEAFPRPEVAASDTPAAGGAPAQSAAPASTPAPAPASAAAAAASAAASPAPAAAEAPAPVKAAPDASEFGLSEAQLRARDPERSRAAGPDQIEARVVGLDFRATGERVITLDNGQVWLQTEVTVRGPLKAGDTVRIRKAALSSFQLVTPGRVALRVRRLE